MINKFLIALNKVKGKWFSIPLEKFLFWVVSILTSVLLITQVALISDSIRPYLSDIDTFEGRYISEYDNLIEEGTITIQIVDMSKDNDISILVNGLEYSKFNTKEMDIKVRNNSVVEIDGSKIKSPFRVRIVSQSDNIKSQLVDKEIIVKSCIEVLARIKLK